MQYLPDVIKLHLSLYEMCHHRVDEEDAQTSFDEFIRKNVAKGTVYYVYSE